MYPRCYRQIGSELYSSCTRPGHPTTILRPYAPCRRVWSEPSADRWLYRALPNADQIRIQCFYDLGHGVDRGGTCSGNARCSRSGHPVESVPNVISRRDCALTINGREKERKIAAQCMAVILRSRRSRKIHHHLSFEFFRVHRPLDVRLETVKSCPLERRVAKIRPERSSVISSHCSWSSEPISGLG